MAAPIVKKKVAQSEKRLEHKMISGFARVEMILSEGGFREAIKKVNRQEDELNNAKNEYKRRFDVDRSSTKR